MFSMIDNPGRASTSTSRPSLSVTTSLTMTLARWVRDAGRDYNRRSTAVRECCETSARVVRIEAAATIAPLIGLHRGMPVGRFRGGLLGGFCVRIGGLGGFRSSALLAGLGVGALLGLPAPQDRN